MHNLLECSVHNVFGRVLLTGSFVMNAYTVETRVTSTTATQERCYMHFWNHDF